MITRKRTIAIIGAGAIGGITAAFLRKGGYDIDVVCKYPELAETITTRGLHITGVKGDFFVSVPAVAHITDLKEKKDVIFLATKATAMLEASQQLVPLLKEDGVVVSLQNGICEPALAEVFGKDKVIGCVVGWGATMHSPGELEMTSTGEFVIGTMEGGEDPRLQPLQEIMNSVLPTHISKNIFGNLYSKLIVNACITSLGAICGLYLGEMLAMKKARNVFIAVMKEAIAVSNALHIRVEKYAGKLDYYSFIGGGSFFQDFRRHFIIRAIGFKYRRLKSSVLQSLERRQKTEIEYLNGYICREGRKRDIPTPVNDRIVAMIHEIEAGARRITVENFQDPVFNRMGVNR